MHIIHIMYASVYACAGQAKGLVRVSFMVEYKEGRRPYTDKVLKKMMLMNW